MRWTRRERRPQRAGCRLSLETLESRELLSNVPVQTAPNPLPLPQPAETLTAAGNTARQSIDSLIGASATRAAYHVDGSGLSAAVIDTGVNYNHEALGGGMGPGYKVPVGLDLAENDSDPNADTWQHGTAVAGILASSDPSHLGVAPGADIVPIRVFNDINQGSYDLIAQGLQWVVDHHEQYHISVVNLSLADGKNYSMDWFSHDGQIGQRIADLIHQLKLDNIPVVSASGNSFNGQQGMGFTAILPETISVTATDPSDHLLSDAQRLGSSFGGKLATDLAAPGSDLVAPVDGNNFMTVQGTSFAAPMVSGTILLLQSIYQKRFGSLPSVDQIQSWLQGGSDPIHDDVTGINLDRLDVLKAASLVPAPSTPPVEQPQPVTPPQDNGTDTSPSTPTSTDTGASNGGGDSSGSPSQTPTPPVTSPPSDTSNPSPPAQTEIFRNGLLIGTVVSDSQQNPLAGSLARFGLTGSFSKIQAWGQLGGDSPQGTFEPGSAQAAGTLNRSAAIEARREALKVKIATRRASRLTASKAPGWRRAWAAHFAGESRHG